jgi:glycosyltransferase involved in cell wall biosynthesis
LAKAGETQELVSELLPAYSAARYLSRAVESILSRTYERLEWIAVDDGSTDGSVEILKSYEANDPRVRLVSRRKAGYALALNEGLTLARGGLLARMDAAEISTSNLFDKPVDYLSRSAPEPSGCAIEL